MTSLLSKVYQSKNGRTANVWDPSCRDGVAAVSVLWRFGEFLSRVLSSVCCCLHHRPHGSNVRHSRLPLRSRRISWMQRDVHHRRCGWIAEQSVYFRRCVELLFVNVGAVGFAKHHDGGIAVVYRPNTSTATTTSEQYPNPCSSYLAYFCGNIRLDRSLCVIFRQFGLVSSNSAVAHSVLNKSRHCVSIAIHSSIQLRQANQWRCCYSG